MTTWTQLSRSLRMAIAAPYLLLLVIAGLAAEPPFHALQVNGTTHQPAEPLSLSSTNVTGTLADARLSANVPLAPGGALALTSTLYVSGATTLDDGGISTDGASDLNLSGYIVPGAAGGYVSTTYGGSIDTSYGGGSVLTRSGGGTIDTSSDGGYVNTSNGGGSIDTSGGGSISTNYGGSIDTSNAGGFIDTSSGGAIDTSYGGGHLSTSYGGGCINTNGYGSPADAGFTGPVGSLYCDQDPSGASGHVLWVMESAGWVGK